jgi:hypothetical protein
MSALKESISKKERPHTEISPLRLVLLKIKQ